MTTLVLAALIAVLSTAGEAKTASPGGARALEKATFAMG